MEIIPHNRTLQAERDYCFSYAADVQWKISIVIFATLCSGKFSTCHYTRFGEGLLICLQKPNKLRVDEFLSLNVPQTFLQQLIVHADDADFICRNEGMVTYIQTHAPAILKHWSLQMNANKTDITVIQRHTHNDCMKRVKNGTWALTEAQLQGIESFHHKQLRSVIGNSVVAETANESAHTKTKSNKRGPKLALWSISLLTKGIAITLPTGDRRADFVPMKRPQLPVASSSAAAALDGAAALPPQPHARSAVFPQATTTTTTIRTDLAYLPDADNDHEDQRQHDDDDDETEGDVDGALEPPRKTRRHLHTGVSGAASSSFSSIPWCGADSKSATMQERHSCLAAPYGANDAQTAQYFNLVISKAKAPVVCASAGKIKGKAIYAGKDIEQASRIWTESPFVAMQHEANRERLRCCQYCFVPLLSEYKGLWRDMAARWNASAARLRNDPPVMDDELDLALQQLKVNRANCGLAGSRVSCVCGEVYCSKLCQLRAYHEHHAILCPRDNAYSAMSQFLTHMRHTNDIFLLVAKVIARVLSRYFTTRDILKAREPMDMFYKKPWWEVVMMEKQIQHVGHTGVAESWCDGSLASPDSVASNGTHAIEIQGDEDAATVGIRDGLDANHLDDGEGGLQAQCLRELLTYTHQLLLDAIECNLVHLEREDQLHGVSVDDIWTSCASILSFEFFAAQLGLFEMNNISMEIDHPFRGLIEILDPDVHADETDEEHGVVESALVSRVRRVLEHEEAYLAERHSQETTREHHHHHHIGGNSSSSSHSSSDSSGGGSSGFLGVEGTALFPIVCTMNHSCEPNCTVLYTKDGNAHVVAVRDIQKGEELCICYIDIDDDVHTRQVNLREYQFKCFCARCSRERRQVNAASVPEDAQLNRDGLSHSTASS
ncbi:Histone-lysine n-methyltransferase atxr2, partial [Globisporangium splendens]